MSIHPSLSSASKGKSQRTVLKRTERIKDLMKKGQWDKDKKVFGLPKTRILRIKIKKEKAAKKTEAEATATTDKAPTPAPAAAPSAEAKKAK